MRNKVLIICTVLAIIFSCSSCKKQEIPAEETKAKRTVYEIRTDVYAGLSQEITDSSLISTESQQTVETDHPNNQALQINDTNYPLTYNTSIYYPKRDLKVHSYSVNAPKHMNDADSYIELLEDGTPYRYSNIVFGEIDLSQVQTDEQLVTMVQEIISPYVDVSRYSEVSVSKPSLYVIDWYDMIGEYKKPGGVNVVISSSGVVWQIIISPSYMGTMDETKLLSDSEVLRIAQDRIEQSELANLDSAIAQTVKNKYCMIYNNQFSQCCTIEVQYKDTDPETNKQYNCTTNLQYIIPIEAENNSEVE